ncbi:hypothetical protein BDA96_06G298300 [Sorghum bicolor]|uniref:Uncharacterized protein n=1 Tax=Sorghum bicolor TaxID=4558 RepID=A0A921QTP6_SORBI|nr:hypothetical protein BDA96_06G298300 [Sorghum bicolor]
MESRRRARGEEGEGTDVPARWPAAGWRTRARARQAGHEDGGRGERKRSAMTGPCRRCSSRIARCSSCGCESSALAMTGPLRVRLPCLCSDGAGPRSSGSRTGSAPGTRSTPTRTSPPPTTSPTPTGSPSDSSSGSPCPAAATSSPASPSCTSPTS